MSGAVVGVCARCGAVGDAPRTSPGSGTVELLLWFCMVLPGIVYSVWRSAHRSPQCATCGGREILPLDSPRGQALAAESGLHEAEIAGELQRAARIKERQAPVLLWVAVVIVLLWVLSALSA